MNTKLTLRLDKKAIEKAKKIARIRHSSLSKMVEKFFFSIDDDQYTHSPEPSPIVRELSGVIHLDDSMDYKGEYRKYIEEKYK